MYSLKFAHLVKEKLPDADCYEFYIDGGRVQTCRMSAPTDRVFASDGPVVQLLQRLRQADRPLLAVRWVLAAYDPCLEVQVESVGA